MLAACNRQWRMQGPNMCNHRILSAANQFVNGESRRKYLGHCTPVSIVIILVLLLCGGYCWNHSNLMQWTRLVLFLVGRDSLNEHDDRYQEEVCCHSLDL